MNDDKRTFVEDFNASIKEAENFLTIARCSELQRKAIASLDELRVKVRALKIGAIAERDEYLANLLLGYQCVVEALAAEIEMWILLKEENPDAAWDKLVEAQMSSLAACRAHPGFSHVGHHYQRLETIETLVFPPQIFVSSGMLVKRQECSICGIEYEDCGHLIGMPYMGEFCSVVAREIELDHVAIVENPADKACRIREFDVVGGVRNRMTWRVEEKDTVEEMRPVEQLRAQAILLRTRT